MALLSRLKALLGLTSRPPDAGGTTITVEREPAAEGERAVKEPVRSSSAAEPAETEADDAEADVEPADAGEPVQSITGIGPAYAEQLAEAGVETVGELAAADAAALDEETGLGVGRLADWIERAKRF